MIQRRWTLIYGWAILAIIFLLNAKDLNSYFIRDDFSFIHAFHDKGPAYFMSLFFKDYTPDAWEAAKEPWRGKEFLRPLMAISFKLDFLLYGTNPVGYHLTNLLFHTLNSVLIFSLINLIAGGGSKFLGAIGGLLYAVNPVHAQSVTYISGRAEVMATFFSLLSCYLFIRYRATGRMKLYVLSLVFFLCGLFTKETIALLLPVLLVGYDIVQGLESITLEKIFHAIPKTARTYGLNYLPYLAILAGYFVIRKLSFGGFVTSAGRVNLSTADMVSSFLAFIRSTFLAAPFSPPTSQQLAGALASSRRLPQGPITGGEIFIAVFLAIHGLWLFYIGIRNLTYWRLFIFGALFTAVSCGLVFPNIYETPRAFYFPAVGVALLLIALIFSLPRKELRLASLTFLIACYGLYQLKYNSHYAAAGSIPNRVLEAVENTSVKPQEGDILLLMDIPEYHKTVWVSTGDVKGALRRPFVRSQALEFCTIKRVPEVTLEEVQGHDVYLFWWNSELRRLDEAPSEFINLAHASVETQVQENVRVAPLRINDDTRLALMTVPPTKITYKLRVPKEMLLSFGIALDARAWGFRSGEGVCFEVAVQEGKKEEKLFSKSIDPKNNEGDRRWRDYQIDLSGYGEREVFLSLITHPGEQPFSGWTGWGNLEWVAKPNLPKPMQ